MSNAMYNRIIVVELISVFFATFSMVLSILIYESRSSKLLSTQEYLFRYYNLFGTISLICCIVCKYQTYLKWYVSRGLMSTHDTVFTTGWWKKMFLEILIIMIAPYPFLQSITYQEYID